MSFHIWKTKQQHLPSKTTIIMRDFKFQTMRAFLCALVLVNVILCFIEAAPAEDEIIDLPGLTEPPPFKQYSGYLDVTYKDHLFYWFVEAETVDPATAPIVFWFNGGPGCSSLDGFLTELGPFRVNDDGETLSYNPYSWNKIANMIFLESPAGVGFSYSDDGEYITNDDVTAKNNYIAIGKFYEKFPEYLQNELFITGESYAGIYVPMLSWLIVNGSNNYNFQGFAVGNGLHDAELNYNSEILFNAFHGLHDYTITTRLLTYCCEPTTPVTCNFYYPPNDECRLTVFAALFAAQDVSGINIYGVYDKCESASYSRRWRHMNARKAAFLKTKFPHDQEFLKKMMESLNSDPPCSNSEHEREWINTPEVRAALHVPDVVQDWVMCSDILVYVQLYYSMKEQYDYLLPHVRALIYHGDTDTMCNYLGGEWFAEGLGRELPNVGLIIFGDDVLILSSNPISTEELLNPFRPWRYENQTAGFVKDFSNLTYLTILGSGHTVPTDRPAQALAMFKNFINNTPYDS